MEKSLIDEIKANYGVKPTVFLDTGLIQLNEIWGGGLPLGKIIELYSLEGVGKTTICLQIAVKLCSDGYKVGYIDAEAALEESFKESVGVTPYEEAGLFVHTTATLVRDVERLTYQLLDYGCKLLIIDSLTAVHNYEPQKQNKSDVYGSVFDGQSVGSKSRVQAMYLETVKAQLKKREATLILINQMRTNISFHGRVSIEPAGGTAQRFYADIRTGISRKGWIVDEEKRNIGVNLELMCIKNKVCAPFRVVLGNLYFGRGISVLESIIDTLIEKGVIRQSGAYFKYGDQTFKGKAALKEFVRDNKESLIIEAGGITSDVSLDTDSEGIVENSFLDE